MSVVVSHVGRIRCVIAYCTCRKQLGKLQSIYELRILGGEDPVDVLDDLKLKKLCCRLNMLFPTTFPILDSNESRIINEDITEQDSSQNIELYNPGPRLYLDNVPDFPIFN
jgi:DNA-directed RNA polymerase subunit N (RpoN/RPB10)